MKAKDLLNQSSGSRSRKDEEQDQVAAAYESISKKLENLRNGASNSDEVEAIDDEEGDKKIFDKPLKDEAEEAIKKPEPRESESDEEEDPLDREDDEEEEENELPAAKGVDLEDESLDQDDIEKNAEVIHAKRLEPGDEDDVVNKDEEGDDETDQDDSDPKPTFKNPPVDESEPDSLDDLADEPSAVSDESTPRPTFTTRNIAIDERSSPVDEPEEPAFKEERVSPTESFHQSEQDDDEQGLHIRNLHSSIQSRNQSQPMTQHEDVSYEQVSSYGSERSSPGEQPGSGYGGERSAEVNERTPGNFFAPQGGGRQQRRGSKWHVLVLLLIGLGVIGGTVYLLKSQFASMPAASPTPAPIVTTPEPTPTPVPELDRAKYKIRVLNGTTTAGLAKSVSETLKEKGYPIDKAGNAPKQDFKQTEIKVKSSATGLFEQLKKDLAGSYDAGASASAELKDTDAADAEVIIGGK